MADLEHQRESQAAAAAPVRESARDTVREPARDPARDTGELLREPGPRPADERPLQVARDLAGLEELVGQGVDSQDVVVCAAADEAAALAHARRGIDQGIGPAPLTPHRFPLRYLIVLPTYNEAENLRTLLSAVRAYLDADVLIVDDASPDGTGDLADELAASDEQMFVMHREGKGGLASAYLDGFAWAIERGYARVFEMDADFSHPPWDLPRLARAALDHPLVIGSRYTGAGRVDGWNLRRRMLSRGANFYARTILGAKIRDLTAGYRCYDVEKLSEMPLKRIRAQGYAFQVEMTWRWLQRGNAVFEVPIRFVDRRFGESKMGLGIALEAIVAIPRMRFRK